MAKARPTPPRRDPRSTVAVGCFCSGATGVHKKILGRAQSGLLSVHQGPWATGTTVDGHRDDRWLRRSTSSSTTRATNYASDEEELLRAVEEIFGQSFTRIGLDSGSVHRCRAFDIEFTLVGTHDLVDDCGIAFTNYKFQLQLASFTSGTRMVAFGSMYEGLSLFLAERLSGRLLCRTIVVENLQREVAVFGPC